MAVAILFMTMTAACRHADLRVLLRRNLERHQGRYAPYSDANGDGSRIPDYIQEKAEFEALTTGATPERVFAIAKVPQTTQEYRQLTKNEDAFVTPFNTGVPDLVTMAKGALNVLDNNKTVSS